MAAAFAVALCGCDREFKEVEITTGYEGPARTNPFLAAERFAEQMGKYAEMRRVLAPFPDESETMVVPAESVVGIGIAKELAEWIGDGGHVIYLVRGANSAKNDFTADLFEGTYEAPAEPDHALLEKFGIEVVAGGSAVSKIEVGEEEFRCDIDSGPRLNFKGKVRAKRYGRGGAENFESGRPGAAAIGSFRSGRGRLTVVADAEMWRNSKIGQRDHAALFWKVLNLDRDGYDSDAVNFVLGVGTSFWGLLTHYAWMALIGLALAVGVWLWKNLTGFGPPLDPGGDHSRDFTEHVSVAGKFLWSKRRADVLLDAAKRRIRAALRRTHATLDLDSPEAADLLAASSDLPPDRVRQILLTHGTTDATAMTRIMRDLQTIEQSL